jgi:hypothetical protein
MTQEATETYSVDTDGRGVITKVLAPSGMVVRYYTACSYCMSEYHAGGTWFPSHYAMASCQSGGRNHCTCDTCF